MLPTIRDTVQPFLLQREFLFSHSILSHFNHDQRQVRWRRVQRCEGGEGLIRVYLIGLHVAPTEGRADNLAATLSSKSDNERSLEGDT